MKFIPSVAAFLLFTVVGSAVASAQEIASTFDQLRVLVKSGDKITVTDASGRETSGRIETLSSSALALLIDGARREFTPTEVSAIRQRKPDTLATGAKIGFGIGAGLGLLVGSALASEYDEIDGGEVVLISLMYGALGAGIGVGIDAMVTREQVIFARPAGSTPTVRLAPLVTPRRRGLAIAVAF
jgi:hypothetical protein